MILSAGNKILHGVAARSLALEIGCRFQRAGSKYAAVFGAVAQADTFRRAKEANFVLPGYRSAAERQNADFVMLALTVAASPANCAYRGSS